MTGLALATLVTACGCSDDGGNGVVDGGIDAAIDAGSLEFETQATDLANNAALFDVAVTEDGTANTTSSAPNGRAVLELTGDAAITHELTGYLENRMQVSAAALAAHVTARQPQLSELVTEVDIDNIYSGLGLVRDTGATQVLIYIRQNSDFAPAAGVSINAGASQTLVRRGVATFELGDTVIDDALVLVVNAPGNSLAITPSATCLGATDIGLDPGQLSSTFLVCE